MNEHHFCYPTVVPRHGIGTSGHGEDRRDATRSPHHRLHRASDAPPAPTMGLVALAYELLDAHGDTADLVSEHASPDGWSRHLAYLSDLQRKGREALAGATLAG